MTKKYILPTLLVISCFGATTLFAQDESLNESHYRIYSVSEKREVTIEHIITASQYADVVFFGEEHNDSVAHFLELKITEEMFAQHGENFAIGMEMFDRDVQPVMNEYLKGFIREKHFNKDARIWSNYHDYKPIVEFAKANSIDVVCSNSASRYTNLAGRKGQEALMTLPKDSKPHFAPLPYDTASGPYYDKLMALMDHSPSSPSSIDSTVAIPVANPMMGFNLIMGQSLWDATMAYSISQYLKKNKKKKLLHINGKFHSDEGFGIVTQLKKYRSKTRVLVISTTSDENFPNIDWSLHLQNGDYIIITDPEVPRTFEE
ncbi:MAG: ChaN family lipoprotein [Flavobacteriales bacterium]|nr:ChaN family lipoprotein [Flavobacteriales bacterium]